MLGHVRKGVGHLESSVDQYDEACLLPSRSHTSLKDQEGARPPLSPHARHFDGLGAHSEELGHHAQGQVLP